MNMKPGSLWRIKRDLDPGEAVCVNQMKGQGERWPQRVVSLGTKDVFLLLGPENWFEGTPGYLFLVGDMYFWANDTYDMDRLEPVTK